MVLLIWEGGGLYGPRISVVCRERFGALPHGELKKKKSHRASIWRTRWIKRFRGIIQKYRAQYKRFRGRHEFKNFMSRVYREFIIARWFDWIGILSIIFLSEKVISKECFVKISLKNGKRFKIFHGEPWKRR